MSPSPLSPTDASNHYWTAEVNDLVGGWIVTNAKKPLSQIHSEEVVSVDKCEQRQDPHVCKVKTGHYVIAETTTEQDAIIIASALNRNGVRRP